MTESQNIPADDATEIWREIPGFEGFYEASTLGRIRSLDRLLVKPGAAKGYPRWVKGKVLRPGRAGQTGYLFVGLAGAQTRKRNYYVSRLVLVTFRGPASDEQQACHGDGNVENNSLDNLRWGTRLENESDKVLHGTLRQGEDVPVSKLKADDILRIRALQGRAKQKDIASQYGITQSMVSMIFHRRVWQHLP